jgi:transaldolase
MNATRELKWVGQSLWLDNITRGLFDDGALARYIKDLSVTGLTSNPTIFQKAIEGTHLCNRAIHQKALQGKSGETLFFDLAIEDLRRAERPNLFIKIPGTPAGLAAIEESIFRGVPINVTLLFSSEQYVAAANACMRGIERRLTAKPDPKVRSVASLFISRWDVAVKDRVAPELQNRLGIAIAQSAHHAYRELLASPRWRTLADAGAVPQRLLWASTGTKDPKVPDTLYLQALAAADTINTIPDKTLQAFAESWNDLLKRIAAKSADLKRTSASGGQQ